MILEFENVTTVLAMSACDEKLAHGPFLIFSYSLQKIRFLLARSVLKTVWPENEIKKIWNRKSRAERSAELSLGKLFDGNLYCGTSKPNCIFFSYPFSYKCSVRNIPRMKIPFKYYEMYEMKWGHMYFWIVDCIGNKY